MGGQGDPQPDTLPNLTTSQILLIAARECRDQVAMWDLLGSFDRTVSLKLSLESVLGQLRSLVRIRTSNRHLVWQRFGQTWCRDDKHTVLIVGGDGCGVHGLVQPNATLETRPDAFIESDG